MLGRTTRSSNRPLKVGQIEMAEFVIAIWFCPDDNFLSITKAEIEDILVCCERESIWFFTDIKAKYIEDIEFIMKGRKFDSVQT